MIAATDAKLDHAELFGAYLPEDRLVELAGGPVVGSLSEGSVLFADVVGFTRLTTRLAQLFGPRRGAEEVPLYLNRLYEAVISEVTGFGGSAIGFAGDAVTCWFAGDDGMVATACALAMQGAMAQFAAVALDGAPGTEPVSLALKVTVGAGRARRFVVGDPAVQLIDVIAGGPVARIETLERVVSTGQVVVGPEVAAVLGNAFELGDVAPQEGAAAPPPPKLVLAGAARRGAPGAARRRAPPVELLAPWLLPTVRRRLGAGAGDFLTELRPVAALFVNFAGIDIDEDGEAAGKLDEVVRRAQHVATEYEGNVLQVTSGDKGNYLYLAFGAPVAHEDDVRRAAAAALDLRDALSRLGFLSHLSLGLGHGAARTGAYGSAARRTYGALGEGTNMAARMMSAAPHGRVYASGDFAAALGDGFVLRRVPGVRVKGRDAPVRTFELTCAAAPGTGRGVRRRALVGRERELALLRGQLEAARTDGRVVQLVADAGMGKSELLTHALAGEERLRVVRGGGQAFGRAAPYQLWRGVYGQLLGLGTGGTVTERVAAVTEALTVVDAALAAQAPLLAPVLDLPLDEGAAPGAAEAEERGAARRALLLAIFRHAARETFEGGRTLVLLLEDLHWLDPASEELLQAVAQAVPAAKAALFTTSRPGGGASPPPGAIPGATLLELAPLEEGAAREVAAARLTAEPRLDARREELVDAIVTRSGGNPFYLHELVTDLLQRVAATSTPPDPGAGARAGRTPAAAPDLPTSLHSLILGRLDRLTDAQRVNLKVASVVGREFRSGWVAACRPGASGAGVEAAFLGTDAVGLTRPLAPEPPSHEFNHAITHEVAYESQARADRARLHTALARYLEAEVASPAEPHLDLLAYHYALGVDAAKARYYLAAAGAAAKAAYANRAALYYYGRLLSLQTGAERLATLLELGEVASFVGDYGAARSHLDEALVAATEHGAELAGATALRLLGELLEREGDHAAARERLEAAAITCRRLGAAAELTRVLLALGGNVLWHLGDYDAAEAQLAEAVRLARAAGDARATARALHGAANIHLYRGDTAAAEATFSESLAVRRAAGDDYGVANGLNNLAIVRANAGDAQQAEALFAESLAIRRRLGDAAGVAVALNNLGYMAEARGDLPDAKRLYEESLAARRQLGDRLGVAVSLNNLAGLTLRAGDAGTARALYGESAALAGAGGNRREAAIALAGLAEATEDPVAGARMALAAEHILAALGAAVEASVWEQIARGKARLPDPGSVPELGGALTDAMAWALTGRVPSRK